MEIILSAILVFMIAGAIYALFARDLLSALISCGIVGYGLVICFLLLQAPDLAIVQIVVETITLIIMIAVVLDSSREELKITKKAGPEPSHFRIGYIVNIVLVIVCGLAMLYFFREVTSTLDPLGSHLTRMSSAYTENAAQQTGSANLVTGVVFDFRGYDTLGEATILFTAVIGVLTILRAKGRKNKISTLKG
jgi:multicomponent Na+:H+ antiporter subunit B